MANIVFILGAGASREAHAPLMADFLDVAENLLRSGTIPEHEAEFTLVFRAVGKLQSVHSKAQLDLYNIEHVFNALEMARIIGKLPGITDRSADDVIRALKVVIAVTLQHSVQFQMDQGELAFPPPYKAFTDLITRLRCEARPKRGVAVITFNYDLAADFGLYRAGMGPDYCLGDPVKDAVPLLKLHGSINWGFCAQCRQVVPCMPHKLAHTETKVRPDGTGRLYALPYVSRLKHTACDAVVQPLPFIVPPTWNKTDQQEVIQHVWKRAAKELEEAEHIFVVGYSLPQTDGFFRTLYALGVVSDLPLKTLRICDPAGEGSPVDKRFRALVGNGAMGRYKFIPAGFANSIGAIRHIFSC